MTRRKAIIAAFSGTLLQAQSAGRAMAWLEAGDYFGFAYGGRTVRIPMNEVLDALENKPPKNGSCPVCGTMAEKYDREALMPKETILHVDGACYAGSGLSTTTLTNEISVVPCSINDIPKSRLVRCKHCNASFWQDAEK